MLQCNYTIHDGFSCQMRSHLNLRSLVIASCNAASYLKSAFKVCGMTFLPHYTLTHDKSTRLSYIILHFPSSPPQSNLSIIEVFITSKLSCYLHNHDAVNGYICDSPRFQPRTTFFHSERQSEYVTISYSHKTHSPSHWI